MQYPSQNNQKITTLSKHKVLLIDLENCPSQIKQLQSDLTTFSQVVICYAQNSPKIPLDWLMNLTTAINDNKLKIIKMENGGKNSADFGICFFAGVIMQSLPEESHFVVISNDTDLDHVVRLLVSQGRSAERIGKQKDEIPYATEKSTNLLGVYCTHLITYSKNRPAKEETLINSIKNKFKDIPSTADDIFKSLKNQLAIEITDGKVTYNDAVIKTLANGKAVSFAHG